MHSNSDGWVKCPLFKFIGNLLLFLLSWYIIHSSCHFPHRIWLVSLHYSMMQLSFSTIPFLSLLYKVFIFMIYNLFSSTDYLPWHFLDFAVPRWQRPKASTISNLIALHLSGLCTTCIALKFSLPFLPFMTFAWCKSSYGKDHHILVFSLFLWGRKMLHTFFNNWKMLHTFNT